MANEGDLYILYAVDHRSPSAVSTDPDTLHPVFGHSTQGSPLLEEFSSFQIDARTIRRFNVAESEVVAVRGSKKKPTSGQKLPLIFTLSVI